jgi:hypothetical protein
MRKHNWALACVVFVLSSVAGAADDVQSRTTLSLQGAYYFSYLEGWGVHNGLAPVDYGEVPREDLTYNPAVDPGRDLGWGWGNAGLKVGVAHAMRWPLVPGPGPLLEGNNLKLTVSGGLSPVALTAKAEAVFTPIAVAEIALGGSAGTGWSIGVGNGLGRNLPGPQYREIREEPLSGLVLSSWLATTLQFDFEALWPGDWHHIAVSFGPRVEYWALTSASGDEAWQWEGDEGENFNGWRFVTRAFVGYLMPLKVDTAGVLVETMTYLDAVRRRSPMDDPGGWGSDFVTVTISPLVSVAISERTQLTMLLQIETARDYTSDTIGYRYFEYRDYDGWYLYLKRFSFALSHRL